MCYNDTDKEEERCSHPGVTAARSIADGAARSKRDGCRFMSACAGTECSKRTYFLEVSVISKKALINEEIKAKEVRVVSADGAQIGVLSIEKALRMAFEAGLDLVEIAPEGKPPVCKIMDFGRYRFEREKREKEIRKNQQTTELKELQLTCNIGQHDLQTKLNHATRFLTAGNKVKVIVKFRGREMAHTERGRDLLDRFAAASRSWERWKRSRCWTGAT